MSPEMLEMLSGLPTHVILIVALYVLWKRLEKLTDQLIDIKKDVQFMSAHIARQNIEKQEGQELPF